MMFGSPARMFWFWRFVVFAIASLLPAFSWSAIDWGGGASRVTDSRGVPHTKASGCAVVVAVKQGSLIDFSTFIPQRPADNITPGAELSDGSNTNVVLAASDAFYQGFLLSSAIKDISIDAISAYGLQGGEPLFSSRVGQGDVSGWSPD